MTVWIGDPPMPTEMIAGREETVAVRRVKELVAREGKNRTELVAVERDGILSLFHVPVRFEVMVGKPEYICSGTREEFRDIPEAQ
jgi:hypothetical protein